jgi:hypothetical protein
LASYSPGESGIITALRKQDIHKICSLLTLDKPASSVIVFIPTEAGQEKVSIILPNLIKGEKMRRLLGLAVLFVVLCASVPSYGYFLIYKVSATINGDDEATDQKVTIPLKAYLVLQFNDSNGSLTDVDLVLYGKNTHGRKVYLPSVYCYNNQPNGTNVRFIGKDMVVSLVVEDFYNLEILMSGPASLKDIGMGTSDKKLAAVIIKGVASVWGGHILGPYSSQEVSGTANVSATLWIKGTRRANQLGWSQDTLIFYGDDNYPGLAQILQDKKYLLGFFSSDGYEGEGGGISIICDSSFGLDSFDSITTGEINAVDINGGL